ncbi:MAG: DUF2939 domain-containing protein [Gemmatimonadales bacterium]
MTRRRSPLPWLLACTMILVACWFWIAPHRAYDRLVEAVAFGSATELAAVVDFPTVRQQLKDDLQAAIARRSRSRIGSAVTATLLESAIDATLTPSGLANLITAFGTRTPGRAAADTLKTGTEVSYRYHSLSRVDIHIRAKGESDAKSGILTFTREGARWRLSRIWSEQLLGVNGGT